MKHDSIKKDGGPHECFTWAKPLIPRILWFPTICPVTHDQKRSEEMDLDVSEFRGPIFIFIFFNFVFYKNRFRNLQEYTRLPGGRHPVALLRGGRGFSTINFRGKFVCRPLENRSPGRGAAGPQAARQWGGGSWPPASRVTGSPTLI